LLNGAARIDEKPDPSRWAGGDIAHRAYIDQEEKQILDPRAFRSKSD